MIRSLIQAAKPHLRPSLIIIGAQKSGTTSLFHILKQHPKVLVPAKKELHFFESDERYAQGMDHYWRQFPKRPFRQRDTITLEATPSYLFFAERTAPRIKQHLPAVKLLAILRDPVERAFSAWNMYRMLKDHPLHARLYDERSFEQAVNDELNGNAREAWQLYLARGHYSRQLKIYLDHFPREQLMVLGFSQLKRDPHGLFNIICDRLGIPSFPADHPSLSLKAHQRPYISKIDPALKARLYAHFAEEPDRLQRLLGERIDLFEN